MQSKARSGHAVSKTWTRSNAQDSTVCGDLQTRSVQLSERGIVIAIWSLCENEWNTSGNRKKEWQMFRYIYTNLNRKHEQNKIKTIVSGAILILFFFFKTFCISTHVDISFFVFFLYKVFINTFHVPKSGAWRKRCSIVAFHQLSSLST